MISDEIMSLNEIIDSIRRFRKNASVEIKFNNKGKVNKVFVRSKSKEISDAVEMIQISRPDLSHADFSGMIVSDSDLSGFDLHESDFSGAILVNNNLSATNLYNAKFDYATISQTDMSNSNYFNNSMTQMTGSVNLYNVNNSYTPTGGSQYNSSGTGGWPGSYGRFKTVNNPY